MGIRTFLWSKVLIVAALCGNRSVPQGKCAFWLSAESLGLTTSTSAPDADAEAGLREPSLPSSSTSSGTPTKRTAHRPMYLAEYYEIYLNAEL